jgi:hypothetical protein
LIDINKLMIICGLFIKIERFMKNLSAWFLAAATTMTSLQAAEQEAPKPVYDHSGYFDVGLGPFPIPLPVFGIGQRMQWDHHGMDLHLLVSTIVAITEVKGTAMYLYYFKPSLASQFYVGGGLGAGGLFPNNHSHAKFLFSPEVVLGKQYTNEAGDKRFFQTEISWPTLGSHHPFYFPLVVFSYGIMF